MHIRIHIRVKTHIDHANRPSTSRPGRQFSLNVVVIVVVVVVCCYNVVGSISVVSMIISC